MRHLMLCVPLGTAAANSEIEAGALGCCVAARTGRLWVYARDDRPWQGPDPPAAVYLYSPDRKAERPAYHLARFSRVVRVDGYPGFDQLGKGGTIRLAACRVGGDVAINVEA